MGRPRKVIDRKLVEDLAQIACTYDEIAAVVNCSTDTLKRRFADCIEKGRSKGKTSLRRAQWSKALEGNPTMLIWLGKQELGQTDKQQVDPQSVKDTAQSIVDAIKAIDADIADAA